MTHDSVSEEEKLDELLNNLLEAHLAGIAHGQKWVIRMNMKQAFAQALPHERQAGREEQWNQDRLAIEHRKYGADEMMTAALLHAVSALEHTNPAKKKCTFKCGRPLIDCQETCQRE